MTHVRALAVPVFLSLIATPLGGQESDPADVSSIDGIVAAVYDVISGPAGEARDWDRWRSLFMDGARLIPVGRAQDGSVRHRVITPDEYAAGSGPVLERDGFFEREIGRVQESFGQVAHLFSAYESRRSPLDEEPFARGINSFQLFNDGTRWWVVSIMWDSERPGNPIPDRYIG
ncbi:MAG TPA: hypothetical protein VLA36_00265 [Longimicrobiales bacterium]|nr:hypothetical protein [Longimicrobiales bacterium]